MPKKTRHWVRHVWKKCPVTNAAQQISHFKMFRLFPSGYIWVISSSGYELYKIQYLGTAVFEQGRIYFITAKPVEKNIKITS